MSKLWRLAAAAAAAAAPALHGKKLMFPHSVQMLLPWVLDNFAHPFALTVGTLFGCSCSSSQERICHWVWFPEL